MAQRSQHDTGMGHADTASSSNSTALLYEYIRVVEELLQLGKYVVLIYEVPEHGWNVRTKIQQNQLKEITTDLSVSYDVVRERNYAINNAFDILQHRNLTKIYPERILCKTETNRCYAQNGTHIFYNDSHHLNKYSAQLLFGNLLKRALRL